MGQGWRWRIEEGMCGNEEEKTSKDTFSGPHDFVQASSWAKGLHFPQANFSSLYTSTKDLIFFVFFKGDATDFNNCSSQCYSKGEKAVPASALFYRSRGTYPAQISAVLSSQNRTLLPCFFGETFLNRSLPVCCPDGWEQGIWLTLLQLVLFPGILKWETRQSRTQLLWERSVRTASSLSTLLCRESVTTKRRWWQCDETALSSDRKGGPPHLARRSRGLHSAFSGRGICGAKAVCPPQVCVPLPFEGQEFSAQMALSLFQRLLRPLPQVCPVEGRLWCRCAQPSAWEWPCISYLGNLGCVCVCVGGGSGVWICRLRCPHSCV